eukprot:360180-Chlamydomonas_euryale.AAC.6
MPPFGGAAEHACLLSRADGSVPSTLPHVECAAGLPAAHATSCDRHSTGSWAGAPHAVGAPSSPLKPRGRRRRHAPPHKHGRRENRPPTACSHVSAAPPPRRFARAQCQVRRPVVGT